jgi:hypothetical protein
MLGLLVGSAGSRKRLNSIGESAVRLPILTKEGSSQRSFMSGTIEKRGDALWRKSEFGPNELLTL